MADYKIMMNYGSTSLSDAPPMPRLLFLCSLLLTFITACQAPPTPAGTLSVSIANQTFQLELALDDHTRHQGLSDRAEIAAQEGMLFVFPSPRELTFVMRRCLVPIDLIYLDPAGRIVALHAMAVEPYDRPDHRLKHYRSGWPAQFAIELQGGMIDKLELKIGQIIALPVDDLKRQAR